VSDKPTDADPVIEHLRQRRVELRDQEREIAVRISEIDAIILTLEDGRSRVSKQRRQRAAGGNSGAADGEKPQPSFLRPDADAAAEQEGGA
jgi:hypothetical protein